MTRHDAGMDRPCPRCEAAPDEPCWDERHGRTRDTTHTERKPKEPQ